jgi:hypothetical protein
MKKLLTMFSDKPKKLIPSKLRVLLESWKELLIQQIIKELSAKLKSRLRKINMLNLLDQWL